MTRITRETADRIAKLFREYETYAVDPDDVVALATDYIALLDEVAAARKENERLRQALKDITTSPKRGYCDYTDCIDIARAALHSATERTRP